ncbi:hypothetical protein N0V82_000748 [Gnomoniopsis sp. IMI 355080]|nr:hypothetical protein N0V82_000748 [Gnomoniopsis sp. IMI 355080]
MGKRKKSSRKPDGPKKNEPLPTVFNCLFCNHEKSVNIKIEKKLGMGSLECKVCGQHFQTPTNYLSAAVDVYADWVDAAELAAQSGEGPALGSLEDPRARANARKNRDDEEEADISDGGDPENPRYAGSDIVADDEEE